MMFRLGAHPILVCRTSRTGSAARRRLFAVSSSPTPPPLGRAVWIGAAALVASGASGFALSQYFSASGNIRVPLTWSNKSQYGSEADFARALDALRAALPAEGLVSTDEGERLAYATGVGYPLHNDVVTVVNISRQFRIPLVPYTGGTSLERGIEGSWKLDCGAICVDLSGMDEIVINEANADAVVQAGVSWNVLNDTLKEKGIPLFFPLDPGLGATIAGMISTGCSGTNAMRYGTARGEWIINMTVVLPSGEVIKTRTLGIITEATIRLAPVLPSTVAVVQFPSVRDATEAACEVLNLGAAIQCVELLDTSFLRVLSDSPLRSTRPRAIEDTLYIKIQGAPTLHSSRSTADVDAQMMAASKLMEHIMKKHHATLYELARNAEEAEALWTERRSALFVLTDHARQNGRTGYAMDVCVPVSRLPELVDVARREFEKAGLVGPILGHVGDGQSSGILGALRATGNFHAFLSYKDEEEQERVKAAADKVVAAAIDLEGTCTGEHGVGTGKKKYLNRELGLATVATMKSIKKTLDPLGLFNPEKLYPDD
ncbi:hypothetical protein EW146_g4522 [Bondarzewia mesenterica]|uniref:D-lactate dehydrogenase (cytochrome) n=1 Tax=Bondarzewia mesenterica TaxID=1095465 RepID=A0A4S4LW76_9AGAM|nr:hypothetical protein EW146_g4522 [Bondarzewia mesenterica]